MSGVSSADLPLGWERVLIGTICDLKNGYAFRPTDWSTSGLPIVRIQNLNNPDALFNYYAGQLRERFIIQNGDLLFAWSGTPGTSFGAHLWRGERAALNQHIFRIDFDEKVIVKKYFMLAINQKLASLTERAHGGVGLRHVTKGKFEETAIELPPYKDQCRIVAKIETLFSELDKGIESLKTAREQLKVYRQAVLKHAFEGKLTAQWREQNKDKLETPEQLLARIQQERQARYHRQLQDWQVAVKAWEENGKNGRKLRKPKSPVVVPPLTIGELSELPTLPDSWLWIRPEQIAADEDYAIGIGPFGSNLKVSDYREAGVPLIFVRNITKSNFSSDLKYIDIEKFNELTAHSVKPLDLVVTKMGDPPGDCEIYPKERPEAVLTADCLKFRVFEEIADRRFYKNCINSNIVKRQLGLITKGVAQKKISVNRFKTILLPLPSVEEQSSVSDRIEEIFSIIDHQEASIAVSLERAEVLRQSILKKAFAGQLVPQDPSDEPASALLARIQTKKSAHAMSKASHKNSPSKGGRKARSKEAS
jgi:type I restriction enzyme S subunit